MYNPNDEHLILPKWAVNILLERLAGVDSKALYQLGARLETQGGDVLDVWNTIQQYHLLQLATEEISNILNTDIEAIRADVEGRNQPEAA